MTTLYRAGIGANQGRLNGQVSTAQPLLPMLTEVTKRSERILSEVRLVKMLSVWTGPLFAVCSW